MRYANFSYASLFNNIHLAPLFNSLPPYNFFINLIRAISITEFEELKGSSNLDYRPRGVGEGPLPLGKRAHRVQLDARQRDPGTAVQGRRGFHPGRSGAARHGLPDTKSGGTAVYRSGARSMSTSFGDDIPVKSPGTTTTTTTRSSDAIPFRCTHQLPFCRL